MRDQENVGEVSGVIPAQSEIARPIHPAIQPTSSIDEPYIRPKPKHLL